MLRRHFKPRIKTKLPKLILYFTRHAPQHFFLLSISFCIDSIYPGETCFRKVYVYNLLLKQKKYQSHPWSYNVSPACSFFVPPPPYFYSSWISLPISVRNRWHHQHHKQTNHQKILVIPKIDFLYWM